MEKLEKLKWIAIVLLLILMAIGTYTKRLEKRYLYDKLDQIIQKQDQIIAILYAPPVYEKKIIFYEAADPLKECDKKPKRIKP